MRIMIPGVPEKPTYAVVASIGITIVTSVLAAAYGLVGGGLIALVLSGSGYWYVQRKLAGTRATAKLVAPIVRIAHAFFAIVSISLYIPLFFPPDVASAACLFQAFVMLRR
jgi:hypothetical protein